MFKRIFVFLMAIICLLTTFFINKAPIFANYSDNYEVYLSSASSTAQILSVSKGEFYFLNDIKGQAFTARKEQFDINEFLSAFSAKTVVIEEIAGGISYYAYSPKIKYKKEFAGETVNLQIFVGDTVKVGSPIIFGSY